MRYLLLALILIAGCSKSPEQPKYFEGDPANSGGIRGVVRFEGPKPAPKRISMDAEEACEKLHDKPVYSGEIVTGQDGELANAFVYVKSGLEGKLFEPAKEAVILDQRGCQFVPRVVALRAGQTISVKNSDPVSHNIHPQPVNNRDWNQQQPPGSPDLQRRFARPEVMIPVKCNVHAWMKSYIAVLDHPYFAVTGASGQFDWKSLPPGQYVVAAWHEGLGESTRQIAVNAGSRQDVTFIFRAPPEQK